MNGKKWLWVLFGVLVATVAFLAGRLSVDDSAGIKPAGETEPPKVAKVIPKLGVNPQTGLFAKVTRVTATPDYETRTPFGLMQHRVDCLIVHYDLYNRSTTLKYDAGDWPVGQLSDEHGNQYRLISDSHPGRPAAMPKVLRPGETMKDVLVFEPPLSQAGTLTLDLQDNFTSPGGPPGGSIEIKIPAKEILDPNKIIM